MRRHVVVRAAYDAEAAMWYVEESDVQGLATEAETLEALIARVKVIIADLLLDAPDKPESLEIDVIAYAHQTVSLAA